MNDEHSTAALRPDDVADVSGSNGGAGSRVLSPEAVRVRASAVLGDDAARVDLGRLRQLTSGHAHLVDLVLVAMRDDEVVLEAEAGVPDALIARVADECDDLGAGVREFLLAHAVGFAAAGSAFATARRFADTDTRDLLAATRSRGLTAPDGALPPIVRQAVLRTSLPDETWSLRRELVDALDAAGEPLADVAEMLARDGYTDPRVAAVLESRADAALSTTPRTATELYELAIAAGADEAALDARQATAAWASGDIRTAERIVDRMLRRGDDVDLCRAVPVAAAVWARRGMLERSAVAYERLAGERCELAPLAATCLVLVGDAERARAIRAEADRPAYPPSSHVATDLAADGLLAAIAGDAERALGLLLRASGMTTESDEILPLPEVPAVLAALVALDAGEAGLADEVLAAAIGGGQGGPAFLPRLLLTRALVALRADRPARARDHLEAAEHAETGSALGLRDTLLAAAVRVGLARHQGEIPVLMHAWQAARPAIASMQVDLTTLPVLAELAIAAARLGEAPLVDSHLEAAWTLLGNLGHPASWSTGLRWTEIEAALLRNEPESVERHAHALEGIGGSRTAGRLARAGRTWAAVLAGDVAVDAVERAVDDLVAAGYPWDAGRLAGHAAGRAAEHHDTLHLLALARSVHQDDPDEPVPPADAQEHDGARSHPLGDAEPRQRLSGREREVARLVLAGKTYVEIGEAIFISPRTAEHHIARIRRRLGASSRSDLMARLRLALEDD
jgi:DNA-binding CsgD family transcriptional regulator